jgi:tetratricopeptide (TPR) repeat protein
VQLPARGKRRRRWLVWTATAMFVAAAFVLVGAALGVRLPGETATGNVSLSQAKQLQRTVSQAQSLEGSGQVAQALELYRQVLAQDPTQEQALAESGWLEYEAGIQDANGTLLSKGQQDEQAAERADPGAYAPHLYLGSMLLVESQAAAAATEFERFLASSPPVGVVQTAWSFIVKAYTQAGEAVPAAPPGVHG